MKLNFRIIDLYREVLVIETDEPLNALGLERRLGGTVKIMQIMDSLGRKKSAGPSAVFRDYFDSKLIREKYLARTSGKIQLGISLYPMAKDLYLRAEPKRVALTIKKILTSAGMSVRVVFPQDMATALPSVVVANEHLLQKGAELDFLIGQERIFLGKTVAVQDFEDYGRRDYQRPKRDARIGMLPPKVAQIMVNLAQIDPKAAGDLKRAVLDPFVGSGTIIQEAMILGFKGVGADISEKAVENADKNLEWIKNRYRLPQGRYELTQSDVGDLPQNLPKLNYEAIITEGTLGPGYTTPPSGEEVEKNFKALERIYLSAFRSFKKLLGPEKRIVIALPAYRRESAYRNPAYQFMPIVDKIVKLGYATVDPLPEVVTEAFNFLAVTPRKSIIYDRKDQFVSREIFIFISK